SSRTRAVWISSRVAASGNKVTRIRSVPSIGETEAGAIFFAGFADGAIRPRSWRPAATSTRTSQNVLCCISPFLPIEGHALARRQAPHLRESHPSAELGRDEDAVLYEPLPRFPYGRSTVARKNTAVIGVEAPAGLRPPRGGRRPGRRSMRPSPC